MISIIVAISKNGVIGNGGQIPWKIKGEQLRFKQLTTGKTIIMGRKSFDEIGKPLPNRRTVLVSRTKTVDTDICTTVNSLESALELTKNESEVFVAGGGQIYRDTIDIADRIYLTIIDRYIEGDTKFPEIDYSKYRVVYEVAVDGEIPYTYYTLERI